MAESSATAYRWDELPCDHPMDLIDRRRVIGGKAMLSHLVLHKGFSVPVHAHANEQFALVLDGHMRFTIEGSSGPETIDVRSGGVLHLPPDVPHGAEAVETSIVVDVFSPPSAGTGVDAAGG